MTVAGWQRACVRGNNNERWRRIVFVVAEFRGWLLTITEIQLQVLEYYPCTTKFTKIGTLVAENYDIVAYGYATVDERYFVCCRRAIRLLVCCVRCCSWMNLLSLFCVVIVLQHIIFLASCAGNVHWLWLSEHSAAFCGSAGQKVLLTK